MEPYLEECLASLAGQSMRDFEAILVDDGSTDGSAAIAAAYADADDRFSLMRQGNAGLGAARNAGISKSSGEYLAFLDADDRLPEDALELLMTSADASGSDFVSGNVRRFDRAGSWQTERHKRMFAESIIGAHITDHPELIYDTMVCNKLFRRSYWEEHDFRFPEGVWFEDIEVAIVAHCNARSVDLLSGVTYEWRERQDSITRSLGDPRNVADRVAVTMRLRQFLGDRRFPELRRRLDEKVLRMDLPVYLRQLHLTEPADRIPVVASMRGYVQVVDPDVIDALPARDRLAYHYVVTADVEALIALMNFRRQRTALDVEERDRHFFAKYPGWEKAGGRLPPSLFRIDDEMQLESAIHSVTWDSDDLVITGVAYLDRVHQHGPDTLTRSAVLTRTLVAEEDHESRERSVTPLSLETVELPDVTARLDRPFQRYGWAGFELRVPLSALRLGGEWVSGDSEVWLTVSSGAVSRHVRLGGRAQGTPQWAALSPASGVQIRPRQDGAGRFGIRVHRPAAAVTGHRISESGLLTIEGDVLDPDSDAMTLDLVRRDAAGVRGRFELHPTGGVDGSVVQRFTVVVPFDELRLADDDRWVTSGTGHWDLYLGGPGTRTARRVGYATDLGESRFAEGPREVVARQTLAGNYTISDGPRRPVVTDIAWTAGDDLMVSCDVGSTSGASFVAWHRASNEYHVLDVDFDPDGGATLLLPVGRQKEWGLQRPWRNGTWTIQRRHMLEDGTTAFVPLRIGSSVHRRLPSSRIIGPVVAEPRVGLGDALSVVVRPDWRPSEMGRYRQRELRTAAYLSAREAPLLDVVLYQSYAGAQYAGNPRFIYEELRRRETSLHHVWIAQPGRLDVPGDATVVGVRTEEYYEYLARARYLINNTRFPRWFRKREGQVYLQTWHSTPLKRIAFDIESPKLANPLYLEEFGHDVEQWDHLISPSPASTAVMRRAFRYEGNVLETGHPRNDIFFAPNAAVMAADVRRELGIPEDRRVVLYAPTWRDDRHDDGRYRFDLELDVERMRKRLGDRYVLLLRRHSNIPRSPDLFRDGFATDVSSYPDIQDLYLVSDLFVTDYSSSMVDFANTGRPMIFYCYDLERYRDEIRGFNYDFENDAPGPIVRTFDALLAAIENEADLPETYGDRYARFVDRFCGLNDGGASAKVVDAVFGDALAGD